jgi:hypothetical protein
MSGQPALDGLIEFSAPPMIQQKLTFIIPADIKYLNVVLSALEELCLGINFNGKQA